MAEGSRNTARLKSTNWQRIGLKTIKIWISSHDRIQFLFFGLSGIKPIYYLHLWFGCCSLSCVIQHLSCWMLLVPRSGRSSWYRGVYGEGMLWWNSLPMIIWGCRLVAIGITRQYFWFIIIFLWWNMTETWRRYCRLLLTAALFLLILSNGISSINPRKGETCENVRVFLDVRKGNWATRLEAIWFMSLHIRQT